LADQCSDHHTGQKHTTQIVYGKEEKKNTVCIDFVFVDALINKVTATAAL
jgi:hypothetical protein